MNQSAILKMSKNVFEKKELAFLLNTVGLNAVYIH